MDVLSISNICEKFIPFYQPIISLKKKKVIGYEGLCRFKLNGKGEIIPFPKAYEIAKKLNQEKELDWICREKLIENFPFKNRDILFLNILANSIESDYFGRGLTEFFVKKAGINPQLIVLEIVEAEKISDIKHLIKIIEHYKSQQFKIALDDFGTGYNTIEIFFELSSYIDLIKIPLTIVKGISKSFIKYELVKTFKEISVNLGIEIVAEGVEHEEDLKTLVELGIDYAQGFLISPPLQVEEIKKFKLNIQIPKVCYQGLIASLDELVHPLETVEVQDSLKFEELYKLLKKLPQHHRYIGLKISNYPELFILNFWEYERICSDYIKFNLLALKDMKWLVDCGKNISKDLIFTIQELKERNQIMEKCEVTSALELAIKFQKEGIDAIFLTEDDAIIGYILKEEVFEKLYKEVYKARIHVNPLTGLPANVIIEDTIESLIENGEPFLAGYLDIDNFKAFNDTFGFVLGDQFIKRTGFFLNRYIKENYGNKGFVGHVGGDDFVFIVEDEDEEKLKRVLEAMIKTLEENCKSFFPREDIERGYFIGRDREGNIRKFPLVSFSVVVINGKNKKTIQEISRSAAKLKKIAKAHWGSKIVFESEIEKKHTLTP